MTSTVRKRTEHADACLEGLLGGKANAAIKARLKLMHAVCGETVLKGKRLTITGVAKQYEGKRTEREPELAESTIRNKRGGRNPYIELYGAWEQVAQALQEDTDRVRKRHSYGEIVSLAEVLAIGDVSLRHRTAQMVTRHHGLQRELDMLKAEIRQKTSIVIADQPNRRKDKETDRPSLYLTHGEAEAIQKFVKSLDGQTLRKTADDGVRINNGPFIADPGFVRALTKVLEIVDPIPLR